MLRNDVLSMTEDENNALICDLIIKTFSTDLVKTPVAPETIKQVKEFLDEFLTGIESQAYIEKNAEDRKAYLDEVVERALVSDEVITGDGNE